MNKLLILLLVLSGCTAELKVGDCYRGHIKDAQLILKVIKVGKFSYESVDIDGTTYITVKDSVEAITQVDCFDGFK